MQTFRLQANPEVIQREHNARQANRDRLQFRTPDAAVPQHAYTAPFSFWKRL
jgi:hypothetical protein